MTRPGLTIVVLGPSICIIEYKRRDLCPVVCELSVVARSPSPTILLALPASSSCGHAWVCVFITAVPIIKLFTKGEGDSGGHVLRETTSRGLCGLVCPSRTSERGGEGECLKEGEGGEEESAREVHVCVLLLQDLLQSCARGGRRRVEDMCYERRRAEACVDESAHHALVNAGGREIV